VLVDALPVGTPTVIECGRWFPAPSAAGLTLTGHFPAVVSSGQELVCGTVDLATANGPVHGVVVPAADLFLVRDGRIVTVPQPQDLMGMRLELAPGKPAALPARAGLSACAPGGGSEDQALTPGGYQLWARVLLNHDDGSNTEVFGGPWPLELS
jgi:hypothetical protein